MDWTTLREIKQIEHNCKYQRSEADIYLARIIWGLAERIDELEAKVK